MKLFAGSNLFQALQPQLARTPEGGVAMFTRRLDLHDLLKQALADTKPPEIGSGPQDL
jgi:hypothetical protein